MPWWDPSRPTPECLTPPNGAAGSETSPRLTPTMPDSRASATRGPGPGHPCRVSGEPVDRVVGQGDRFLVGVEGHHRRHRPEDLLPSRRPGGHPAEHRWRVVVPVTVGGRCPRHLGAVVDRLCTALAMSSRDRSLIIGPNLVAAVDPGPTFRAAIAPASIGELHRPPPRGRGSDWRRCRPRRRCASWPPSLRRRQPRCRRRRTPGTGRFPRAPSRPEHLIRSHLRAGSGPPRWTR